MDSLEPEYRGDRYNNIIGEEALRRQSEIQMFAESCAHNWHTHTTTQLTVPTGEHNSLSGAEVNRLENRVTKVYCTHCLEVKDI